MKTPIELSKFKILLGSKSPRRQELLKGIGVDYKLVNIDVDEIYPTELKNEEIPVFLSQLKAKAYQDRLNSKEILITADTIVVYNNKELGKPKNRNEAIETLQMLSNNKHQVYTGVSISSANKQLSFYDETTVYFKEVTNHTIEYYIDKYEPFDKAGSYGIQDWWGLTVIERIEGDYYNVMGLPTSKLFSKLQEFISAY